MRNKKAQVEVQFNWIYVSIAGAVILSIFVGIAIRMNRNAREQLAYEALNYFDELFTSVQASENTENELSMPGLDLEVDSGNPVCNYYSIARTDRSSMSIEFIPFFSPRLIRTRLLTYVLGWDMPFRVNYFVYMTSPGVAYVSVGANPIKDNLPEHLTLIEVDNVGSFKNQNYDEIRFFTSQNPNSFNLDSSVKKANSVSAIQINSDKSLIYYEYDSSGSFVEKGKTYYIDNPTLIAAIYSDNIESYECNMIKAIKRLNKVSLILKERAKEIQGADLFSICDKSAYVNAEAMLSQMEQLTNSNKIDYNIFSQLNSLKSGIESLNRELNRKSCPTIY